MPKGQDVKVGRRNYKPNCNKLNWYRCTFKSFEIKYFTILCTSQYIES